MSSDRSPNLPVPMASAKKCAGVQGCAEVKRCEVMSAVRSD